MGSVERCKEDLLNESKNLANDVPPAVLIAFMCHSLCAEAKPALSECTHILMCIYLCTYVLACMHTGGCT